MHPRIVFEILLVPAETPAHLVPQPPQQPPLESTQPWSPLAGGAVHRSSGSTRGHSGWLPGAGTLTGHFPAWGALGLPAVQREAEPTGLGLEQGHVPQPVLEEWSARRATASCLAGRLVLVLAKGLPAFSLIKSL